VKLGIALASALAVLPVLEIALRIWNPSAVQLFKERFQGTPGERVLVIDRALDVHPQYGIFQADEKLGYRPVLGGKTYDVHGAKRNEYSLEKPADERRLLFVGDSVTDRARIIEALHEELGEGLEYWNAGVVGYASQQELGYYRDYLGGIVADHVILTFHLNDFETTPVTFMDGDNLVAVYGRLGSARPNAWLLGHSYVYRFYWTERMGHTEVSRSLSIETEVEDALRGFRDLTRERGAEFTVLVLPWLLPQDQWNGPKRQNHEHVLAMLERLGIRHYTFLDTLEAAVADEVEIQEPPGDPQHPSLEFARRMAHDLLARGFQP